MSVRPEEMPSRAGWNGVAGRIWTAGRSLETHAPLHCPICFVYLVSSFGVSPTKHRTLTQTNYFALTGTAGKRKACVLHTRPRPVFSSSVPRLSTALLVFAWSSAATYERRRKINNRLSRLKNVMDVALNMNERNFQYVYLAYGKKTFAIVVKVTFSGLESSMALLTTTLQPLLYSSNLFVRTIRSPLRKEPVLGHWTIYIKMKSILLQSIIGYRSFQIWQVDSIVNLK